MIFRSMQVLLFMASVFVFTLAAEGRDTNPAVNTWEKNARSNGLSSIDIASLKKNQILITDEVYKQIFSAYLSGDLPLFITTDSLLNAYHVLYEESILRLENSLAERLTDILEFVVENLAYAGVNLKGNPELVSVARRRARLVTGIALKLMDPSFQFEDENMNAILDREVEKIVRTETVELPTWLGKPDDTFMALNYSRYKPRGFYSRSETLKQYFRAVSWLQSIPFRVSQDEELLAILMLGSTVSYRNLSFPNRKGVESFFAAYRAFIGAGDDWDLMTAAHEAQNALHMDLSGDALQRKRAFLMKKAEGYGKGPLINDQIRFAPDDSRKVAEPHFRIVPAYRTPSAICFQHTTDQRKWNRPYPDGLEVAAALGSKFARERLADSAQGEKLLRTIDSCRAYFNGNGLYFKYLNTLKALLDEPEPDMPAFMKNRAWQIKSCNTVLAGWAQLRHTWSLQASQTVLYSGITKVPEGFVEPEPEFFSQMADLAEASRNLLDQAGAFAPDYHGLIRSLEAFSGILDDVENREAFLGKLSALPQEDRMSIMLPLMLMEKNPIPAKKGSKAYFNEQRRLLAAMLTDIKSGRTGDNPELKALIEACTLDLERLWRKFESISRRLEVVAHKQLRQADLNDSEVDFIKTYGSTIASIMLYGGNSYLTPNDDAPRVVDVFANPETGGYLHVGTARSRKLYVLYPWKGKTVLCAGAVMPYYEFATTSRLTDESWKKRLDSEKRPSVPKWISPIVSRGNLSTPTF